MRKTAVHLRQWTWPLVAGLISAITCSSPVAAQATRPANRQSPEQIEGSTWQLPGASTTASQLINVPQVQLQIGGVEWHRRRDRYGRYDDV